MAGLRRIGGDLRRVAHGLTAFIRYLSSPEVYEVGLALLSAASPQVEQGQHCGYCVRIANADHAPHAVILKFEIRAAAPSGLAGESAVAFAKGLMLESRAAKTIIVEYDWMAQVSFDDDGASSSPDAFERGTVETGQLYAVTAILCDLHHVPMDALTVYQELVG